MIEVPINLNNTLYIYILYLWRYYVSKGLYSKSFESFLDLCIQNKKYPGINSQISRSNILDVMNNSYQLDVISGEYFNSSGHWFYSDIRRHSFKRGIIK